MAAAGALRFSASGWLFARAAFGGILAAPGFDGAVFAAVDLALSALS
jgi:hypothetical protein